MSTINTITKPLSIAPNGIPTVVRLSQNENGRGIVFELSESVGNGCSAVIAGTKPDGHAYSANGFVSGNKASFSEDNQMTAVAGTWPAKVYIMNGGSTIATGTVCFMIDADPVNPMAIQSDSQLTGLVAQAQAYANAASQYAVGAPIVALTVSAMTDHSKVYLYEGSEAGYTAGNFYYWSGSAWVSGGAYGAGTISVDAAMSNVSTNPVQNKVVNAAINSAINSIPITNNDDAGWGLAVYDHPYSTREWVGMEWEHWNTQALDIDYMPTLIDGNGDPAYNGKIDPKFVGYASSSDYGLVKQGAIERVAQSPQTTYGFITHKNNGTDETTYFAPLLDRDNNYAPSPSGLIPNNYLPNVGDDGYGCVSFSENFDYDAPMSETVSTSQLVIAFRKLAACLDHVTGVDASFATALAQFKSYVDAT